MLEKMKMKFKFLKWLVVVPCALLSCVLLGSWTYDPMTDTVVSDNLFNSSYSNDYVSCNGSEVTFYSNTGNRIYASVFPLNNNTTYTISFGAVSGVTPAILNDGNIVIYGNSFTYTTSSTGNFYIYFLIDSRTGTDTTWIMLNYGSTSLPYEPYGTYVNKTDYDNLDYQYQQLEDEYNDLFLQLQSLNGRYEQLQSDYENLLTQYDDLEDNYNDLEQDLITAQEDFATAQLEITRLNQQIDSINYSSLYQILNGANVYTFRNRANNPLWYALNKSQSDVNATIDVNRNETVYNFYSLPIEIKRELQMSNQFSSTINGYILFEFVIPTRIGINITYFDFNNDFGDSPVYLINSSSQEIASGTQLDNDSVTSIQMELGTTYNYLLLGYDVDSSAENHFTNIWLNQEDVLYAQGFNDGIVQGNVELKDLEEQYSILNTTYVDLNNRYNQLLTRYNEIANSDIQLNFSTLIWNIASTPFEAFKTMWNFNFLGFNIYQFVSR